MQEVQNRYMSCVDRIGYKTGFDRIADADYLSTSFLQRFEQPAHRRMNSGMMFSWKVQTDRIADFCKVLMQRAAVVQNGR